MVTGRASRLTRRLALPGLLLVLTLGLSSCPADSMWVINSTPEDLTVHPIGHEPAVEPILIRGRSSLDFPRMIDVSPCRFEAYDADDLIVAVLAVDEACGERTWTINEDGTSFE
ncbi:hypothetical protein [Euzebya tangerina]|uniref:hypothetical protein n=1 Tax=Euzebya tangerina TaxID=591198 RepID=UPI000E30E5DA|nr:hypothetical protein [Euzebya tangerina]